MFVVASRHEDPDSPPAPFRDVSNISGGIVLHRYGPEEGWPRSQPSAARAVASWESASSNVCGGPPSACRSVVPEQQPERRRRIVDESIMARAEAISGSRLRFRRCSGEIASRIAESLLVLADRLGPQMG